MANKTTVTVDVANNVSIRVVEVDGAGNEIGLPNRSLLTPGHLVNGAWVATDLSGEPSEVVTAASAAWTPEVVAAYKAALLASYVPPSLPDLQPYQFRAMLTLSGHQAALDAFVAGLPDPNKTIAQAKLDYSLTFQRDNSLVLAAQQALGIDNATMDTLWTQAAAIQ